MGFRAGVFALCLIALTARTAVAGQAGKTPQEPSYDPGAVVDVISTVTEVRELAGASPLSGIRLIVKAGGETLECHLGPASFLKEFEISFAKGDRVEIAGSKVRFGDGQIILVREVRKDETTVYLRDKNGNPNWPSGDKT